MNQNNKNYIPIIVSNSYIKKYYLDDRLTALPKEIRDNLKIAFVKLTEEVGGVLQVIFDNENYEIFLTIDKSDDDLAFDEIAAKYKLSKVEKENEEVLADIALFCKFKFNGLV
ncbi:MAG: hypothetical protein IJ593_10460 [Lachnospiraceae bacterium]|nr:hypothetical protein [Lachnospiraceae bacterium]